MSSKPSRVITDVDFARDGKQTGYLSLPFSRHSSAYGRIQIPIICVKNGDGPRVLLVAGNHGDEYEGQVALMRLARDLTASDVRGRIIIVPALNLPAVEAANRASPLDDGNLNRAFPGDADGGPTAMIAHYVESVLLPMSDYVLDLHSGGSSLEYSPCALVRGSGPPDLVARTFAAMEAFAAPMTYITDGGTAGARQTLHAAADRCGVVAITTELGGGGTLNGTGLAVAEAGVRRLLVHIGAIKGELPARNTATRLLAVDGIDFFVFSNEEGIFEPLVELGANVEKGQPAGQIHFPHAPWREPAVVCFRQSGTVICRRFPSSTKRGDCLFQIAKDYTAHAGSRAA
jgi:uncharacterized protein